MKVCIDRDFIINRYITGKGIEIGALHNPVKLPQNVNVKYVDRMSVSELRKQYPELNSREIVNVDIIDDGEKLEKFQDCTQDFVIANHFLEHCQNPIGAILNMLRIQKVGGILFFSIPDKRYTFDIDRPITTFEHLLRDYEIGPDVSKRSHFEEWVHYINKVQDSEEIQRQAIYLMSIDYSIHYHVWTQMDILELILAVRNKLASKFEIELFFQNNKEIVVVLKKLSKINFCFRL